MIIFLKNVLGISKNLYLSFLQNALLFSNFAYGDFLDRRLK